MHPSLPRGGMEPPEKGRKLYASSFWLVPWALVSALGVSWLWNYTQTAGEEGEPPQTWPGEFSGEEPCLVVVFHPHCPCSRASADELSRIAGAVNGRFPARAYFFHPSDEGPEWTSGALRDLVAGISKVEILPDADGREAFRFGLLTSEAVALYEPGDRLVYTGGITDGRGHSGYNPGKLAVVAAIRGERVESSREAVYGCPILGSGGFAPAPNGGGGDT